MIYNTSSFYSRCRNNGKGYVILKAFSVNEVLVDFLDREGDSITVISHWDISSNNSVYWREIAKRCEMKIDDQRKKEKVSSVGNSFLDGKSLELLNETETQVYLKKAIIEENYEMATALREYAKKFR